MSDDLISRQAAIDTIENTDWYHLNAKGEMVSGANSTGHQAWYKADDIYKVLEELPSAQPERKKGKWVLIGSRLESRPYACSECNYAFQVDTVTGKVDWNFCPHCGAVMR